MWLVNWFSCSVRVRQWRDRSHGRRLMLWICARQTYSRSVSWSNQRSEPEFRHFSQEWQKFFDVDGNSRCRRRRIRRHEGIPEILSLRHLTGLTRPFTLRLSFRVWWAYDLTFERRRGRQIKSRKLTQAKYALNFWLESLSLICRGDSGIGEAVLGWGSTATTYPRGFSFNKIL